MTDSIKNYPELRYYLEGSNESDITRDNLKKILGTKIATYSSDYNFSMLDVGASDGEMSLPLAQWLSEHFSNFSYTGVEPEVPAFAKLNERIKERNINYATTHNLKVEQYLERTRDKKELFDFIMFAQSMYHMPKEEWDNIVESSIRLLKPKGFVIALLDSFEGEAYKLVDEMTGNKTRVDTLAFGDLYSAEDLEHFLSRKNISYSTEHFSIFAFVKEDRKKVEDFARHLAFLYRTSADKILKDYRTSAAKFLEEIKKDNKYGLENVVKAIIFHRS